ncbi:1,2-phenylacetyl-CoA epoxidase subunit PaaD [Brevibacterium sp. UCMA 11754]|uniref:1,2-phenylacetyl-CoA epoxidase subunit PaaD n=1 Tax=Brevibacterium sp. UCMA 11754 TaxID=2749198 RepID=UPI002285E1CB|nr:1,2-phenylacetyl-CoA epoxidase subunit PaaD [Brevibacterium sp. UCMA 11754]
MVTATLQTPASTVRGDNDDHRTQVPASENRTAEALDRARAAAARVTDPEMPMLTLVDLGVLRDVAIEDGRVVTTITPTYSGCPAMATMRDDLQRELQDAGFEGAEVRVSLTPAWTSDWITEEGRKALKGAGISPPGQAPRHTGPVALTLMPTKRALSCTLCGSANVKLSSEFGPTACKAMYQCLDCLEPFEHVKEI